MGKLNIITGKQPGALKVCIYGVEGIGKSTLAAHFPRPLFIDTEGSTKLLDVSRTKRPSTWSELLDQVSCVWEEPGICDTLVIDTADWAEKLCIKSVCTQYQKDGIECFDYGKGYTFVYERFGGLLNLLADLAEKGTNVVLTAHATTKRREQPDEIGTYDCWGLKLIDSPKCSIANMVKEWTDILLFANYKTLVVAADDKGKKHKAQGGRRVLYTTHHPCWDAKNRLGLPEEMAMDWEVLGAYLPGRPQAAPAGPSPAESPAGAMSSSPVLPEVPGDERGRRTATPASQARNDRGSGTPGGPPPASAQGTGDAGAVPAVLIPLLESAGVTEAEVREVIAKRQGSFPMGTTWQVMEDCGFVEGWVLPYWKNIVKMIEENPERVPFTMNGST